jgi:hypothetical protein
MDFTCWHFFSNNAERQAGIHVGLPLGVVVFFLFLPHFYDIFMESPNTYPARVYPVFFPLGLENRAAPSSTSLRHAGETPARRPRHF